MALPPIFRRYEPPVVGAKWPKCIILWLFIMSKWQVLAKNCPKWQVLAHTKNGQFDEAKWLFLLFETWLGHFKILCGTDRGVCSPLPLNFRRHRRKSFLARASMQNEMGDLIMAALAQTKSWPKLFLTAQKLLAEIQAYDAKNENSCSLNQEDRGKAAK